MPATISMNTDQMTQSNPLTTPITTPINGETMSSSWRTLNPAQSSTPQKIAPKTMEVPRSG